MQGFREKDDFKIFFDSAYSKYMKLGDSYLGRNAGFLMNSLLITISHAQKPAKNPTGFGLSLGSIAAVIERMKNAEMCKAVIGNAQSSDFLDKTLRLFRTAEGFDINILKEMLLQVNITTLSPEEQVKLNKIIASL